jgi:hypothetical protein
MLLMEKAVLAAQLFVLLVLAVGCIQQFGSPAEIHDQSVSGDIWQDQVWSGNIHVTGDITVAEWATLTILPGTVIRVAALSDDQHSGRDHPHDEPFPKDPDRIETKSVQFAIKGVLKAVGTPDKRIVFTSDSEKPTTYDWDGLYISRGRVEYAIIEYARYNNIQEYSDVVIVNSTIRNSLECCLGIGHSRPVSPQILDNDIYNCGHEGIDNAGGSAIIRGNHFYLENPEVQPDPSRGKNGLVIYQNTYPTVENNMFEGLNQAIFFLEVSRNKKEEGRQAIIRNNIMVNNNAAFAINPGYQMEFVLRENNTLINNSKAEIIDS